MEVVLGEPCRNRGKAGHRGVAAGSRVLSVTATLLNVTGNKGDGLAAAGTAIVLELFDPIREILEIGDSADEDL
jgi:hypothetical protein